MNSPQEKMINRLLLNENSVLVRKVSSHIVGRFSDKPLGDLVPAGKLLKSACNALVLVGVRDAVERETLDAIEKVKKVRSKAKLLEIENGLEKNINASWDNLINFLHEIIAAEKIMITEEKKKEHDKDETKEDKSAKPSRKDPQHLETVLGQLIQIGEIELGPYLAREKSGIENLASDIRKTYEKFRQNPEMSPLEKVAIYERCFRELSDLNPGTKPEAKEDSTYPIYMTELRKILYDLTVNALKLRNKDSLLNAPLFKLQLENEIREFRLIDDFIKDIYLIRVRYNNQMPSSETNEFFGFADEMQPKAVIHWLENRLRQTYNLNIDTEADMHRGEEDRTMHFALCRSLMADLMGAKNEMDAYYKATKGFFSCFSSTNTRLGSNIANVINRHPEFKSMQINAPRNDTSWSNIKNRIRETENERNAGKTPAEITAEIQKRATSRHHRRLTTRIQIYPRPLTRLPSQRNIEKSKKYDLDSASDETKEIKDHKMKRRFSGKS